MDRYLMLMPVFPFLGFCISWMLSRGKTRSYIRLSGGVSIVGQLIPFVLAWILFFEISKGNPVVANFWNWISFQKIDLNFSLLMDELSVILAIVLTGLSSIVALYSIGSMREERNPARFFAYFSLFVFFMLLFFLAENFLVLFIAWEGVSLCSFLFISYKYTYTQNVTAGIRIYIINFVSTFAIIVGMIGIAASFDTLSFVDLKNPALGTLITQKWELTIAGIFVVLGIIGKAGQFPINIWLSDTSRAPMPVSAIAHSTFVLGTGIFLLCRLSYILVNLDLVLQIIAFVGAITAIVSSIIALTQKDIKTILIYVASVQIGYMMMACGATGFSASIFHFFTHAFFMLLLFLAVSLVMPNSKKIKTNIFLMGGLKHQMPIAFWCFLIGVLAINGIPGFSGFFSKDEIFWTLLNDRFNGPLLYILGLISNILLVFSMTKMLILIFLVGPSKPVLIKEHSVPDLMIIPVTILAFLSVVSGYFALGDFLPSGSKRIFSSFLENAIHSNLPNTYSGQAHFLLLTLGILSVFLSMALAYYVYFVRRNDMVAQRMKRRFYVLWKMSYRKFYYEKIEKVVVKMPIFFVVRFVELVIERFLLENIIRLIGILVCQCGAFAKHIGAKNLQGNILYMIIGIAVFVCYTFVILYKNL